MTNRLKHLIVNAHQNISGLRNEQTDAIEMVARDVNQMYKIITTRHGHASSQNNPLADEMRNRIGSFNKFN